MSELLKKLATQFGYEGREEQLAAELKYIVNGGGGAPAGVRKISEAAVDDFPKTPAESKVELPHTAEEAKGRHVFIGHKPKGK